MKEHLQNLHLGSLDRSENEPIIEIRASKVRPKKNNPNSRKNTILSLYSIGTWKHTILFERRGTAKYKRWITLPVQVEDQFGDAGKGKMKKQTSLWVPSPLVEIQHYQASIGGSNQYQ
ncbi:hypothetical protein Y032_0215g2348 [Ancylostoma ceylanicum]|uniref:Uncharacterized protein n=1 Tax=Ancylostoma ceylanicum TaxID=53326 RepID=A0A016SK54_9BILA|nr:hypothetical protein Y032_0215g2348 [Ancylostoma ceylanicum]